MERLISIAAMTLLTAAFVVSCTDDMETGNGNNRQEESPIVLDINVNQDWRQEQQPTRSEGMASHIEPLKANGQPTGLTLTSTVVNGINSGVQPASRLTRGIAKNALEGDFTVLGYEYNNTETWGSSAVGVTYKTVATANTANTAWTLSSTKFWPGTGKTLRYVGYSPATNSCIRSVADVGTTGVPTLEWEVTTTVTDQEDLMTAVSPESTWGTNYGKMTMPFKHALTCIKFAIGTGGIVSNAVIKSIEILNVAKRGTLHMEESGSRWVPDENSRTNFIMDDLGFSTNGVLANTIIAPAVTNGEQQTTMLMIPQQLTEAQTIRIVYHDNNENTDKTVAATLEDQTWLPGTTVTYLISTNTSVYRNVLTATSSVVGHQGGQLTFEITSYAANADDGTYNHDLPWRIVGYSDDEGLSFHTEKPASCNWVGIVTTSGTGGPQAQQGVITVTPTASDSTRELSMTQADTYYANKVLVKRLKDNQARGSNTDYFDLSTHDLMGNKTPRSTANCYVINAPGYYKLPLIYGNAIENGRENSIAWQGTPAAAANGTITTPYIKDNGSPDNGVLCWQDADGLVTVNNDLEFDSATGEYYLLFRVNSGTIQPGNAVIAVRNGSTILWSWHIWVTPTDIYATKEVTNRQGYKYKMMSVPLGWVQQNGRIVYYSSRSMLVKVQQSSGLTAVFRISQSGGSDVQNATYGYAPYYQWGRKDPMLPSKGTANEDHDQFPDPSTNTLKWQAVSGRQSLSYAIQHPNCFTCISGDWCSSRYHTLWNANGYTDWSDAEVEKTIYDPCPVGFHVVAPNFATGFTKTGGKVTSISDMNVEGSCQNGWFFYTNSTKTETIFLPFLGDRQASTGNLYDEGNGYFWLAMTQNNSERGIEPYINSSTIGPQSGGDYKAWGFTVMPCMDN